MLRAFLGRPLVLHESAMRIATSYHGTQRIWETPEPEVLFGRAVDKCAVVLDLSADQRSLCEPRPTNWRLLRRTAYAPLNCDSLGALSNPSLTT